MKNEEKDFAVVCVVGQPGSGKDTLAKFLVEKAFLAHFHG